MKDFSAMPVASGVTFLNARADRFKTSLLVLQIALPLRLGEGRQTAANALLPYLLHRSCARFPTPRAMERRLNDLYGARLSAAVSKLGETHLLTLQATAIDDRFALGGETITCGLLELLLELLLAPNLHGEAFAADAVELEKRLMLERLESEIGSKRTYVARRIEALMCSNEAYGLHPFGEAENIAALTPRDLADAWRGMLKNSVMQFTLVSTSDGKDAFAALQARFASMDRTPSALQTQFIPTAAEQKYVREEQTLEQAKLMLGFRAGMRDAWDHADAARVMLDLFGGGPYSKLFLNVREKMSLCYYCRATLHRYKGIVIVASGVDSAKAEEAQTAILAQLEDIKNGAFEQADLDTSIRSLCDAIRSAGDTPEGLAGWYDSAVVTQDYATPEEYCARFSAVTRGEVIAAANGMTLDTIYLLDAKKEVDA
ncbi:MAG: insulinase family protein [Oscillospiraceae bacterium]|jgi:predicted Zn-dependent peptidase|nr:insulinase family protein [Oscillospiraceae bacterium]